MCIDIVHSLYLVSRREARDSKRLFYLIRFQKFHPISIPHSVRTSIVRIRRVSQPCVCPLAAISSHASRPRPASDRMPRGGGRSSRCRRDRCRGVRDRPWHCQPHLNQLGSRVHMNAGGLVGATWFTSPHECRWFSWRRCRWIVRG